MASSRPPFNPATGQVVLLSSIFFLRDSMSAASRLMISRALVSRSCLCASPDFNRPIISPICGVILFRSSDKSIPHDYVDKRERHEHAIPEQVDECRDQNYPEKHRQPPL